MADADVDNKNNLLKTKMIRTALADDIQHQIDDQIRMREGAMKLMSACSTLNQALETSKNLLTINARILGLMSALQKEKKQHVLEEYNRQRSSTCTDSEIEPCSGKVAISDIRVPLMWKDNVHLTGKTGDQAYYAFALIRCGDQVRDTPLYEVTSADTDMYFEQALLFNELMPDFKMDFEIYYTVITSQEAHGIRPPVRTPMNLRTNKRTVHFNAPKFCLAGHVQLTIDDVHGGMISRDLVMGGQGASGVAVLGDITEFPIHPMELWGQICCTLAAQPKCMLENGITGTCKVMVENTWEQRYCRVYPSAISCWISEHHKSTKPCYVMSFTDVKKVSQIEDEFQLDLISSSENVLHSLRFEDAVESLKWLYALRGAIINLQSWKFAVTELMHIQEAKKHRLSIPTQASFYDQIDIESLTNGVYKHNGNHITPTLDNIDEDVEQLVCQTEPQSKTSNESLDISTPLQENVEVNQSLVALDPTSDEAAQTQVVATPLKQLTNSLITNKMNEDPQTSQSHKATTDETQLQDKAICNELHNTLNTNDLEVDNQNEDEKTKIHVDNVEHNSDTTSREKVQQDQIEVANEKEAPIDITGTEISVDSNQEVESEKQLRLQKNITQEKIKDTKTCEKPPDTSAATLEDSVSLDKVKDDITEKEKSDNVLTPNAEEVEGLNTDNSNDEQSANTIALNNENDAESKIRDENESLKNVILDTQDESSTDEIPETGQSESKTIESFSTENDNIEGILNGEDTLSVTKSKETDICDKVSQVKLGNNLGLESQLENTPPVSNEGLPGNDTSQSLPITSDAITASDRAEEQSLNKLKEDKPIVLSTVDGDEKADTREPKPLECAVLNTDGDALTDQMMGDSEENKKIDDINGADIGEEKTLVKKGASDNVQLLSDDDILKLNNLSATNETTAENFNDLQSKEDNTNGLQSKVDNTNGLQSKEDNTKGLQSKEENTNGLQSKDTNGCEETLTA